MKILFCVIVVFFYNLLFIYHCHATELPKEFINSIGMEFVLIPNGTLIAVEGKQKHIFFINKPYYIGKYEVTIRQWETIMKYNPIEKDLKENMGGTDEYRSHRTEWENMFKDPLKPVVFVGWNDAQAFVSALNKKEGKKYQLPSEAEWEYAARAGTTTRFFFGNDPKNLGQYAWYAKNSDKQTHPVGQLKPNPWGLYDIYGNVAEWCRDKPAKRAYDKGDPCAQETLGSRCVPPGDVRFTKGGGWNLVDWFFKVTDHDAPRYPDSTTGFRLILHTE